MKLSRLLYFGAACAALFCISHSNAATITVTNTSDSGAGTLRQAIHDNDTAGGGNVINFSVTGTIELVSALTMSSNVTIVGPGARLLTVERNSAGGTPSFTTINVVGANTVATISGLTISGGSQSGIFNGAVLTLNSCAVTNNIDSGTAGAGIYNGGTLILNDCTVASNHSTSLGGGIYTQGSTASVALNNCTIADNTAAQGGGIHYTIGTLTVQSSTIAGNSSGDGGGIFSNNPGHPAKLGNTIVAGNTLSGSNGSGPDVKGDFTSDGYNLIRNGEGGSGFTGVGDQVGTAGAPINANLSALQNNGGPTDTKRPVSPSNAIDQGKSFGLTTDQRGRLRTNDNPSLPNAFQGDGTDIGAVETQPSITSTVTNNNDTFEGSLRERILDANGGDTIDFAPNVTGTITLTSDRLVVDKSLTIAGPGARKLKVARSSANGTPRFTIFAVAPPSGDSVNISGLTIANGDTSNQGGGISNSGNGTLAMSNCAISGNHCDGGGGGLYNNGSTVTLANCTFSGNTTNVGSFPGGGIYNAGPLTMSNCTLAGNSAGSGGGLFTSRLVVTRSCTISGNSAGFDGGGIYGDATSPFTGTVEIGDTIVAGNSLTGSGSGPDVFGTFASEGYNLIRIGNGSSGFTNGANHDLVGTGANPTNANLGSLQNNGGPTDTEALLSNSPAINAGNNATAPSRDQRGYIRPDTSDIGAFEFNGTIPVTLANIATRLKVETGDNVLIGGFIVTGTQSKKIIVRARGPSLSQFFSGVLANPVLELYQGNTLLETNDDWKQHQTEVEATGIAPTNDLESAIVRTVTPNSYTAIVRGVGNGTGIALVEVYDLDRTGDSKLANISSRGLVQSGDNVIIGGFIVLGSDSQKVIVRALGPSTGVPGAMANPTLELYDVNGAILEANDDWQQSANKQAIIDSGIPPTNNLESAIVRTLPPANYTAIVRGASNTTGVAVVEVYALQ